MEDDVLRFFAVLRRDVKRVAFHKFLNCGDNVRTVDQPEKDFLNEGVVDAMLGGNLRPVVGLGSCSTIVVNGVLVI